MAGVSSHDKALGVEVGAVDEDLIVDAVGIWGVGDVNKPEGCEAAVESPPAET